MPRTQEAAHDGALTGPGHVSRVIGDQPVTGVFIQ